MKGPALLFSWRKGSNLSQAVASKRFRVSKAALCDYERGLKVPRVATALRIARETAGGVPVEAWDDDPDSTTGSAA